MPARVDYRRLYDRMAPFYGPAMRVVPFWRGYTEALLPFLPSEGRLLELGPGPGVLQARLARRAGPTFGVDLSLGMLRRAQRRLSRAGFTPRLAQGDATRLPFRSNSFAAVATTFAFSAIPDGATAMAELARVLQPGGVLALVDACEPESGNRVARWLARQWERFGDFMRDEAALMRAAGLEIAERREFGAFDSIRLTVGRKPA